MLPGLASCGEWSPMCCGERLESGSCNDEWVGRSGLEKFPLEESSWFMLSCSPRLDPQLMTLHSEVSPPVALSHIFRLSNCKLSTSMAEIKKNQQAASSSPKEQPKNSSKTAQTQIRHCFKVWVCPPRRCILANPRGCRVLGEQSQSPPVHGQAGTVPEYG